MDSIQAIILGVVQGITEFLPVSSSGHLVLLQKLMNVQGNSLLFATCLHVGTLIAVVWALKRDVKSLIRNPLSWTGLMIITALIPTAIVGVVFEELFDSLFRSGATVGLEFIITGVVLWWMDSIKEGHKTEKDMTFGDAIWIGALQGVAILPALSRSGLTISTGIWRGLTRETAGRFSFLLSIPAILGAVLVEIDDLLEHPSEHVGVHWVPVLWGTLAAVVAGYVAVKGTLWLLRNCKMRWFAVYVWILAFLVLGDQLVWHHWFPSLFT